jgi:hypothetical protein
MTSGELAQGEREGPWVGAVEWARNLSLYAERRNPLPHRKICSHRHIHDCQWSVMVGEEENTIVLFIMEFVSFTIYIFTYFLYPEIQDILENLQYISRVTKRRIFS